MPNTPHTPHEGNPRRRPDRRHEQDEDQFELGSGTHPTRRQYDRHQDDDEDDDLYPTADEIGF